MATDTEPGSSAPEVLPDPSGPPLPAPPGKPPRFWLRRTLVGVLALAVLAVAFFTVTFIPYVRDSQGEPKEVLLATWGRDHGLGPAVAVAEDFYYAYINVTPEGGAPTESTDFAAGDPSPGPSASGSAPSPSASATTVTREHLTPPATLTSAADGPALKNEGVWQPVSWKVDGIAPVYATRVRPDATHTSVLASLMWIDTKLASTIYVPGYQEPGTVNPFDGALPKKYWESLVANINGAFRLKDSQGGFIYKGQTIEPLVDGQATFAIAKDGAISIGKWGRDVKAKGDYQVVRQNLALIIDGGKSKVKSGDGFAWGATTDGENLAWRSAIGQRKDGSIVYIGSPGLSAEAMADTLVAAGVQRAMVLDMNNWWVAGFYFTHDADGAPVCHKVDSNIQEGCDRFLNRYKRDSLQFLAKKG